MKINITEVSSRDELVYNMIWERQMFYDNSDNVICNSVLIDICRRAMGSDIHIEESEHPQFRVNKEWASQNGLTANQAKRYIQQHINDCKIGSWYDVSVSVKCNLEYAYNNGIKVSKSKLYEWCKQHDIPTKGNGK